MFKFLKKLIERFGATAPMPIIAPPVIPSEAVTTPPAIPVDEAKPKTRRSPRNQPKPSARRRTTLDSSSPK